MSRIKTVLSHFESKLIITYSTGKIVKTMIKIETIRVR